mgnify:CR=1 FL=1
MMENRPETLACVLAITKLGAIVSMINTTQRDDVLLHSLTTVTPNAAIIGEECMNAFAEVNDQINKPTEFKQFVMADNSSKPAPSEFTDLANASQSASTDNPLSYQKIQMKQTA